MQTILHGADTAGGWHVSEYKHWYWYGSGHCYGYWVWVYEHVHVYGYMSMYTGINIGLCMCMSILHRYVCIGRRAGICMAGADTAGGDGGLSQQNGLADCTDLQASK